MDQLSENGQRAGEDPQLRHLWSWLDAARGVTFSEERTRRKSGSQRYVGVKPVLKGEVLIINTTGTGKDFCLETTTAAIFYSE